MGSPVYVRSFTWVGVMAGRSSSGHNSLNVFSPTMDRDAPVSISICTFDLFSSIVTRIGSEWLALNACMGYSGQSDSDSEECSSNWSVCCDLGALEF